MQVAVTGAAEHSWRVLAAGAQRRTADRPVAGRAHCRAHARRAAPIALGWALRHSAQSKCVGAARSAVRPPLRRPAAARTSCRAAAATQTHRRRLADHPASGARPHGRAAGRCRRLECGLHAGGADKRDGGVTKDTWEMGHCADQVYRGHTMPSGRESRRQREKNPSGRSAPRIAWRRRLRQYQITEALLGAGPASPRCARAGDLAPPTLRCADQWAAVPARLREQFPLK